MNRRRFAVLAVAALLAISAALFLSTERNASHVARDAPLFPGLSAELGTVVSVDIVKGAADPVVSLRKDGERWTVAQRAGYPADLTKVRRLLLALSDAKIVEEKTADPASYALIGVEDPTAPTTVGMQIIFAAKDSRRSVIVGKASGAGNFVRRGDEKQSYLVAPSIYIETEAGRWIDGKLLDIAAGDIVRIDYKPAVGAQYSVHRIPPATPATPATPPTAAGSADKGAATPAQAEQDQGFTLDGVPAGRKAADSRTLAPPPAVSGAVTVDDVAAAASIDFSHPFTSVITMKDGSTIVLTGVAIGDKHWVEIVAPKDEALTSRAVGRAFEVPGYRYDGLFRSLEQLLVAKEAPAKPTASKPPPAKPSPSKTQPATAP